MQEIKYVCDEMSFIRAVLVDFSITGIQYRITRFELKIENKKARSRTFYCEGSRLNEEMIKALKSCRSGSKITLYNLYASPFGSVVRGNTEFHLEDICLTVK